MVKIAVPVSLVFLLVSCSLGGDLETLREKALGKKPVKNYTVTFNLNGGTGVTPPAQTVPPGDPVTLPGNAGFSFPGRAFRGWNAEADARGVNYNAGDSFTPDGDITLYARWEEIPKGYF
ncbi:MAG: InlB B-repeat-containing protein [Burkholderiaceae bacterium]|nr:InlB B-repeat-containing protein [Burkholderiaceae bacterium]